MFAYVMMCDAICNRDNEVTVAPNTAEVQSHIAPLLSSGLYHHKIDSTGLTTYAVTSTTSSGTITIVLILYTSIGTHVQAACLLVKAPCTYYCSYWLLTRIVDVA
jgi:hypothetical protein